MTDNDATRTRTFFITGVSGGLGRGIAAGGA